MRRIPHLMISISGPSTLAIFSGIKSDTEAITLDKYFSDFVVLNQCQRNGMAPPMHIGMIEQ